jgi:hypothetical protein
MAIGLNSIIKDGRLQLPLYHGTSDLFLDSIKEHGLGSKNPISELGVIKTLERVVQLAEKQLKTNDNYAELEWMYQNFINQKSSHQNWQHGQVYASLSKGRAHNNKYGSEIISETIGLYNILDDSSSLSLSENPILALSKSYYKPLVIKVENYPIEYLQSERRGDSVIEDIKSISEADDIGFQLLTHGLNFRLLEPVLYSSMGVEEPETLE